MNPRSNAAPRLRLADTEAEADVLSAALTNPDAILALMLARTGDDAVTIVQPAHFTDPANAHLWRLIALGAGYLDDPSFPAKLMTFGARHDWYRQMGGHHWILSLAERATPVEEGAASAARIVTLAQRRARIACDEAAPNMRAHGIAHPQWREAVAFAEAVGYDWRGSI